jgi:hypothetical protein
MTATLIPYAWISTPLSRRPASAVNAPVVTQPGGAVGYSTNAASITRYGLGAPPITLNTLCTADPGNLATFLTTYQSTPRPRQPVVRLNLIGRTEAECQRILSVGFAQWVQITGAPAAWPPGAANFTVQGFHHVMGVEQRYVDWQTAALIGASPTAPGPWFKWDSSSWDGTDTRPF